MRAAKSSATSSIRLVWPFLAFARRHGHDLRSLTAERLGLTLAEFDDPETRVPQQRIAELLEEFVAASGQRDIGLIAARYVDSEHFGIGEYVARTRPTLRAAIETTGRYLPLLGEGAGHSLERRGKQVIVRIWFSADVRFHEAAYEFAMAIGVLRARRITGIADLAPIEVQFMHRRPADTTRHQKLFRCPIRFEAETTAVVMSAEFLEMRMAGAEPALGALLERQAQAMLERLPRSNDVTSRVRLLLGGAVDLRAASAERIAQRLAMSVRTLSRKLADEGTGYRDLVDEARKQVALRELAQNGQPIAEIADRLGFASPQSFHRAFRRWTGTTADEYRKGARPRTAAPSGSDSRSASRLL